MFAKELLTAFICILLCHNPQLTHSKKCGCLEKPPKYKTCLDHFCRPHLTPHAILQKHYDCVCRLGAYRNPWGQCITLDECKSCGTFRTKSFNLCASECPMQCDQPIPNCSSRCVARCDCAPGYVLDRGNKKECVKADCCPPRCPANSKFKLCVSSCRPMCNRPQPRICFNDCLRGGCVCNHGFAETVVGGVKTCVPQFTCGQSHQSVAQRQSL
ncbi:zonadhesin [Rhipicephalus microplus]|uniref:zonadhesin n=1 Tax=Rhipicephalus microplus TaxID=6941 RepID=UPI0018881B0C|nr:zonadhesin-like [Rhipicephalus microplus]